MSYPTYCEPTGCRPKTADPFPTVVCLCGSTRFSEAFRQANLTETLAGNIVLTIGCDFKSDDALGLTEEDKQQLDTLHLRKIDLADEVLILNVFGYIGDSTRKEWEYAVRAGKRVRFLGMYHRVVLPLDEPVTALCGADENLTWDVGHVTCDTCRAMEPAK